MSTAPASRLEAFFLPGPGGQRLGILHLPAMAVPLRGALLHVHAFAEELNITRRMVALQAARLASSGYAVLLLDLHGCGDSSGDFGEARWDGWLDDIAAGRAWLEQRTGMTAGLWATRAGALLALEHARHAHHPAPARLVLWQPVVNGSAYLTQFLRLRLVHDMLGTGKVGQTSTDAMRAQLRDGPLEVAGYMLAPSLAGALDAAKLDASAPPGCPVSWFEVGAAGRSLPLPVQRIVDGWRAQGAAVELTQVAGPAFWSSHESPPAPALLDATCAALQAADHG